MLTNKQVKAGLAVTFKFSGQSHKGIVKTIAGGPEPSGSAVTLDNINPAIQGHPTVTVDASELELQPSTGPVLPDYPPFTAADATWTGGGAFAGQIVTIPINSNQQYLFSRYEDALEVEAREVAALSKMPGVQGVSSVIVDAIAGDAGRPPSYGMYKVATPPSNPPQASDVSIWVIYITVEEVAIPSASPTIPAYQGPASGNDVAGDLIQRQLIPGEEDLGPTDIRGGDTLYIRFLAPTDDAGGTALLMGFWNPA